ncbi:MAG: homoserine dehydrogenase [bacterium]|nr:MAG: homoserine dehydrogenase [bacterium]
MNKVGVGLLGCGVVGSAVVRNLVENVERISARCDVKFEIKKIAVMDSSKKRSVPELPKEVFTKNISDVTSAADVDIVVELIGGEGIALEAIKQAFENGKHIVTANKLLIAKKGEELLEAAAKAGVELGFEASVAGAVPVIRTLKEAAAGGEIRSVFGIINGTANYILTSMTEKGVSFDEALNEAQRFGYAEADPAYDIEGIDAAHKITILANLAFGTPVDFDSVYTEGISGIAPEDIGFARQFGRVIKLMATARIDSGRIDVRVHPAMVPRKRPIARIDGVSNAVELEISNTGRLMLIGPGAGGDATASAVIADMVEIGRNMAAGCVGRVGSFGFRPEKRKRLPMKPLDEVISGYYLRFLVDDNPGVLAKMAGILGGNNISIESVIQKGRSDGSVPVVILTHEARESDIRAAVEKLDKMKTNRDKTKIIRLENGE